MNPQFAAERSVLNRRWALRPFEAEIPDIQDVPPGICEILARRGISDVQQFVRPTFEKSMPDPSVLSRMDEAAAAVADALARGDRIVVFGDYDVDGATSVSLVVRFLRRVGARDLDFYIPDRLTEGYGPKPAAIRRLHEQGMRFLVVLDSGTTAIDAMEEARRLSVPTVILDHHDVDENRTPYGILVNPKKKGDDPSLHLLCAAGIAFLFVIALRRELRRRGWFEQRRIQEPDPRELLGLVALGTVADVMPLTGLNRSYVRLGLSRMSLIPGINALVDVTGQDEFTPKACGFVFGPHINAAGRIDDTSLGTRLLTTDDPNEALRIATRLYDLNKERRSIQDEMTAKAKAMAAERHADDPFVVVYDEGWHPGVIGLAATKLKDSMDRPAFVIGKGGKGSARAPVGFDLGKAIHAAHAAGVLVEGGGHASAGGCTVLPERIDDFRRFLCERARGFVHPPVLLDAVVECGSVRVDFAMALDIFEPTGQGNPSPLVAVAGGHLARVLPIKERHLKFFLKGRRGIMEGFLPNGIGTPLGDALVSAQGRFVDVYGKLEIDTYHASPKVVIKPVDAMVGAPATSAEAEAAAYA